jgi:hypothetical protein
LKLAFWFWRRRFFFNTNTKKYGFPYCGPSWPPGTNVCTNLNLHYIRKLSCKYELFWLSGLWEENDPTPFLHFYDYLPFEKDLALDLYNFEFPLPRDDLYQVWLKLACWFWRRRFLKIFSKFLLFCYYLPLGNRIVLHLYNSEFSLPKDDLCQLWLKLAQRFWRRNWKSKSLTDRRQTDGQTDGQTTDKSDQKSSLELSAQVS